MIHSPARLWGLAAPVALATSLGLGMLAAPGTASAAPPPPSLPQATQAKAAAKWLATQVGAGGYVPSTTSPGTPDLDATANTVLALASAGVAAGKANSALTYLKGHVNAYVTVSGSDGPGQLALLILDAHAPSGPPGPTPVCSASSPPRSTAPTGRVCPSPHSPWPESGPARS
jgi:hypothetical protein